MSWKQEAANVRGMITGLSAARAIVIERISHLPQCEGVVREISNMLAAAERSMPVPDSGPSTSKRAAKSMTCKAGSLRHKVLEQFANAKLTDEEVGDRIGHPRIWPRCSELRSMGLIEETDQTRLCRRTGMHVRVCQITEQGLALLEVRDV